MAKNRGVPQDEFIKLARETQSPTQVARLTGTSVRNATARWQSIENRLGIRMPVADKRASPSHRLTTIRHNAAVVDLQVQDGIVLVGSDAHIWPGPLTTMQRAFLKFAKDLKPTAVIANGDFLDFPGVSRWPSLSWNDLRKKPTVKDELAAVQDYMGQLVEATPGADHLWPAGNHDMRFSALLCQVAPQMEGVPGMELKDHFPQWRACWRVDINGNVIVRHRELNGEHADFRNVVTQGVTLVTGHDHRTGVVPYRSYRGVHYGVRCGHLLDSPSDPQYVEYLESRTPNWHPAFVVLTFKDGGLLYPELVTKHDDGVVCWRGQLIEV